MPRKHEIYWYEEGPQFRAAFLYHLRDNDVQRGGRITKGQIIAGTYGFVAAEHDVFGATAKTVEFRPTRQCAWQGFELPCMVGAGAPTGAPPKGSLRAINYVVAAVVDDDVAKCAAMKGVPVIEIASGARVINLEINRFSGQAKERRATLLPSIPKDRVQKPNPKP